MIICTLVLFFFVKEPDSRIKAKADANMALEEEKKLKRKKKKLKEMKLSRQRERASFSCCSDFLPVLFRKRHNNLLCAVCG